MTRRVARARDRTRRCQSSRRSVLVSADEAAGRRVPIGRKYTKMPRSHSARLHIPKSKMLVLLRLVRNVAARGSRRVIPMGAVRYRSALREPRHPTAAWASAHPPRRPRDATAPTPGELRRAHGVVDPLPCAPLGRSPGAGPRTVPGKAVRGIPSRSRARRESTTRSLPPRRLLVATVDRDERGGPGSGRDRLSRVHLPCHSTDVSPVRACASRRAQASARSRNG